MNIAFDIDAGLAALDAITNGATVEEAKKVAIANASEVLFFEVEEVEEVSAETAAARERVAELKREVESAKAYVAKCAAEWQKHGEQNDADVNTYRETKNPRDYWAANKSRAASKEAKKALEVAKSLLDYAKEDLELGLAGKFYDENGERVDAFGYRVW